MALAAVGHSQYWSSAGAPPGPPVDGLLYWPYNSPWIKVLFFCILLHRSLF